MKVRYYGHSCVEVAVKGKKILFDPFIRPNELATNVDVDAINPDYILVSHGHQDHIADLVEIAKRSDAKVVSNFEIVNWLTEKGVKNLTAVNLGGAMEFEFGRAKYVRAIHSSSFPDGSYAGNPGGFVVSSDDKNFYFAGDTSLTYDMKLIPEETKLDFAMLPIGDCFTMGINDAIKAGDFIQCDKILGIHYDTFPPIEIDKEEAKSEFKNAGKELFLMEINSEMDF